MSLFRMIDIDLKQDGNSISDRFSAYLNKLKLTEQDLRELCHSDFGIEVPRESVASAQTIYTGTFLSLFASELRNYAKPSPYSRTFLHTIEEQTIAYLQKYQDELWAKAQLATLLPHSGLTIDEKNKVLGSTYKVSVINADHEQLKSVHPGTLAELQLLDSKEDSFISAEQLPKLVRTLDRCTGLLLHNYNALLALNLVAANLCYICLKQLGAPLHKMAYLEWLAPIKNIDKIAYSPAILSNAIQHNQQLLMINADIRSIWFLIYIAYQYNNSQAHAALTSFFNNPYYEDLCSDAQRKELYNQLRKVYQTRATTNTDTLKAMSSFLSSNYNPGSLLEQFTQLSSKISTDLQQAETNAKKESFAILSKFFLRCSAESANKRNSSIIDNNIVRLQSGFNYADLYKEFAEFFVDSEKSMSKTPSTEYPVATIQLLSTLLRGDSPILSEESRTKSKPAAVSTTTASNTREEIPFPAI